MRVGSASREPLFGGVVTCALSLLVCATGTTRFELRTATLPDRGGLLAPFARNKPVADFLEWPLTLEFYAYFNSRPGTTLYVGAPLLLLFCVMC
jgi:hypothetical protein